MSSWMTPARRRLADEIESEIVGAYRALFRLANKLLQAARQDSASRE